jgi:outer membrane protein assembly factor BamB
MRKSAAAGVLGVVVLAATACSDPRAIPRDLLYLQSPHGVTIFEPGSTAPSFRARSALPSPDWSTVVRTLTSGDSTRIVALDPSTGIELWSRSAPGRLEVKALSSAGDVAALEPTGWRYHSDPTTTRFVISRRGRADPETIELEGNYAPEAFSTDGHSLFVLHYSPARDPERYQVRRLDLGTGEVNDVYSVDAELQKAMQGTARIQTTSPDGRRLYTLYTLRSGTEYRAFIHVLSLDELWAHCIDLPESFAKSSEATTALTVGPDGKSLYVANSRARVLAEVDTEELTVTRTTSVGLDAGRGAHAAYGSRSALYLGSGRKVVAIDTGDLETTSSWHVGLPVTGLQVGASGKLYIGQGRRIAIFDSSSGRRVGLVDPPGAGPIARLGKVTRSLDEVRKEIICAC